MIYTMLALSLFTIIILIKNYACRHTWFFILMVISLDIALFASILYVSKLGNYRNPTSVYFLLDYKIFLYMSNLNLAFYDIVRLMNASIAMFLFSVNLFTYQFTMAFSRKISVKKIVGILLIGILPLFYLWFYDPITSFDFYIMANTSPEYLVNIIRAMDLFNNLWILVYLFYPVYLMYKFYCVTELGIKKKQIISLAACLLSLNILCLIMFIAGPFKHVSLSDFSSNIISFPDNIEIPFYYYDIMPIVMIIIVELMLVIITKYKGLDSVDLFQEIMINRNMRKLNKNLRSIFHSFKNTIFSVKILAEQVKDDYGGPRGREALERIEVIADTSFNSMTWMINTFKEIMLVAERCKVVNVVEQALRKVNIENRITIQKKYINRDVESVLDIYHITEVLCNLIQNAVEAIISSNVEKGVITIEVSAEHEWAIIKISDNGVGIKKEDMKNVFKSFYTTKSRQNNWGVGLSYAYRVIKAHLGFIAVDSIEGQYTTFQILLPRSDEGDVINGEN